MSENSNEAWLERDAQRLADKERWQSQERTARRVEWTKRLAWAVATLTAVSGLCYVITLAFHHNEIPDPNPTCYVTALHLQPGESVTVACPVTISRDQPVQPVPGRSAP